MLHKLIDHSPDLKRLRDEGFEVQIQGNHILLTHIPYLNCAREIHFGTLVSELTIAGDKAGQPNSHVIFFIGEQPCHKDGSVITALLHGQQKTTVGEGIEIDRSFSNKPPNGYTNYYEKFTTYITLISGPAISMDQTVTAKTFRFVSQSIDAESSFNYPDTNSSRAQIAGITEKIKGQNVAIIGLGGTGSYVLDFVAKTPVKEIHVFDDDQFLLHNAFRSPGAPSIDRLQNIQTKVEYFASIYSKMHKGIVIHNEKISSTNLDRINTVDFVFICIDEGAVKKVVIEHLAHKKISFVDVGIGIEISESRSLFGMLRVTASRKGDVAHINRNARVSFGHAANDDLYSQNIQIAELNALNAALAVIKWKKFSGFYHDAEGELHSLYSIDDNSIINEDAKINEDANS